MAFINGSAASDNLSGSADKDTIYGAAGNDVMTGGAAADIFAVRRGEGSDRITDFVAGPGGDVLRLQGYGFADFSAVRAASVQSGADTVITLASGETLTLNNVSLDALGPENAALDQPLPSSGSPTNWAWTGTEGETLTGTDANDQLTAGAPEVTLAGGAGDDTYVVWDHTDLIVEDAASGIDTVMTYGEQGYSLANAPYVENLTLAGTARSSALGNDLSNVIIGSDGTNRLDGGGGNDVLTGGAARDTFIVRQGEGSDVITDFQATAQGDTVSLAGFGFTDFADIKAALHQVGSDTVLDLGDGATLNFRNSQASAFTESNFALGVDTDAMVQTFSDEFDSFDRFTGSGGTWRTSYEWWGDGAYTLAENGEQQIYVDTNFRGLSGVEQDEPLGFNPFSLEDGKLVITASGITDDAGGATKDYEFTSGMISTQPTFWQTYGYYEITAELPTGTGAWPAFWLLPVDNSWPPEIDVLEAFGDQPGQVHSAVIGGDGIEDAWSQIDTSGTHSYGVLWTPYETSFYVDGVKTMTFATPEEMNGPMYMIANLAVGGPWAGDADPSLVAQYKIDEIVAYQLPEYTLEGYTLKATGSPKNAISGTTGVNTLTGTEQNDWIDSKGGADTLTGRLGDDTYVVRHEQAQVVEKANGGIDQIRSSVNYTLPDNVENLLLLGTLNVNGTGNAQANNVVGNWGNNVITGGLANDVLTGDKGMDTFIINRGDGSDIITDFQTGDAVQLNGYGFSTFAEVQSAMTEVGDDTYLALNSFETLVFRDTDIASFAEGNFRLPEVPPESHTWIRANIGTEGADTMYGSASNERFEGKGGADIYAGGIGDDTYLVDNVDQRIIEKVREGIDTVESYVSFTLPDNVENLTLLAPDLIGTGNALANRMTGSSGDDVLDGYGGKDWLYGGAGDDVFVFEPDQARDIVADFDAGQDMLRFVGYGADAYLTNVGEEWTVNYSGGQDTFHLAGVSSLSADDYMFA